MASSGFALSLPLKSGCHMSCVIMPHAASIATRPCFSSASRYLQGAASCEHLPCAHRRVHVHVRTHASALVSVPNSALHHPAAAPSPRLGSMSARSLLHRLRAGVLGEAEWIKVRQRRAVANQAAHLHLHSHTAGRWAQHHAVRRKGRYPARKRGTRKEAEPAAAAAV